MLIKEEVYARDRSKGKQKKELVPLIGARKIYEGMNILRKGKSSCLDSLIILGGAFKAVIKEELSSANFGGTISKGGSSLNLNQNLNQNFNQNMNQNLNQNLNPNLNQNSKNKNPYTSNKFSGSTKTNFNQENQLIRHERKHSHDGANKLYRSISPVVKLADKSYSPIREKANGLSSLNGLGISMNMTKNKFSNQQQDNSNNNNTRLSIVGNSHNFGNYNHIAEAYNTKSKLTNNNGGKINNSPKKNFINMNNFFNNEESKVEKVLPDVNSNLKFINNKPRSEDLGYSMKQKQNKLDIINSMIFKKENINGLNVNSSNVNREKERERLQERERELTPNSSRKFLLIRDNSERSVMADNIGRKYSRSGIGVNESNTTNMVPGVSSASPNMYSQDNGKVLSTLTPKKRVIINKYASKSKQGMTFDGNYKTNQDSFLIKTKIFNLDNYSVFGVFDGHGMHGHFVSNLIKLFLADYFSRIDLFLAKEKLFLQFNGNAMNSTKISQKGMKNQNTINISNTGLKEEDIYEKLKEKNYHLIKSSFYLAETALSQSKYEVNFSGATCVVVIVVNNKIICANAGDSRAILITEDLDTNEEKIIPLSRDHKPELKDEMQRIVKSGGRVDRYNDNGVKSGPFRVWLKHENFPGLAMSRSVGDFVAESVGVICEPEIFEYTIPNNGCKFIVIASDGVWEFLSNEKIADIVNWYYKSNDPNGAAEKIVEESIKRWKQEDDVIDDITAIVIFFNKLRE